MKARNWSVLLLVVLLASCSLLVGRVACEEVVKEDDQRVEEQHQLVGADNVALRNVEGGGQCMTDDDCHNNGECVPMSNNDRDVADVAPGICRCDERYAGEHCQHHRKKKLTAFLLSLFLGPLGVDRFYLGYIGLGVVKLLLNLFGCLPACIANWPVYEPIDDGAGLEFEETDRMPTEAYLCWTAGNCISCILTLGAMAWWLTDWILILRDVLNDAHGNSLYDNM